MTKMRIVSICVFVILLGLWEPDDNEGLFVSLTHIWLPFFTYEMEYGKCDVDYADGYDVPAWFYEDENETSVEAAVIEEQQEEKVQEVSSNNCISYSRNNLAMPDYLLNHIFVVDNNTSMSDEELSIENLLDNDLTVHNLTSSKESEPKILIYHTHGSECFADSKPGNVSDSIIGVGSYLAEILHSKYGISVYHDETLYDVIDGNLDRSKAYENAYEGVKKILEEHPSIEVVIDLHRDGVDEDTHLVTEVNGKPTAKIMFLNGISRSNLNGDIAYLNNPNKLTNLAFSFQMFLVGKQLYGDYIRKIYVRSLRYNLHVMPKTTLIEAGAQNNTIEEEKNAMEPLADILYQVLSGTEINVEK